MLVKAVTALANVVRHPVNSKTSCVRAAIRYATSQLAARFLQGDALVPFANNTRLLVPTKMKGAAHFINPGLCEFEPMCFVAHALREGNLFIDVGANIGAYTLLASGVANARTIAIEPAPEIFKFLVDNVRLNELRRLVSTLQVGVADKPGKLMFSSGLGTENCVCSNGTTEVSVTTLDSIAANHPPAVELVIKIDTEGFEAAVLEGGRHTLLGREVKALIVERNGNGAKYQAHEGALHAKLRGMGYIPCAYLPFDRKLCLLRPDDEGDIIYVKCVTVMEQLLAAAPAFTFNGLSI